MNIPFVKFQGTGNDFILVDGRKQSYKSLPVKLMCDRNFGIGADGLMILQEKEGYDFEMVYYNSDGNLSSMCGNGGRCIVQWAHQLGLGNHGKFTFWAPDGQHEAIVNQRQISLKMTDVNNWQLIDNETVEINTGSPHYVHFGHPNIQELDLITWAKSVRYNEPYTNLGINVNTVELGVHTTLGMRTYERGVENETLSCGTGVTAAVLASYILRDKLGLGEYYQGKKDFNASMQTRGGNLSVSFETADNKFHNIWLIGPAEFVFNGNWQLN